MSAHLGAWLSPLADGQLPPAQAERALAHVAACRTCAAGLEAERAARMALAAAADVDAAPDLADRLMALSATVPPTAGDPLRERRVGAVGAPAAFVAPLTGDLAAAARRRRVRRGIGIGVGGAGLAVAALFAAGAAPVVVPDPAPAQALTLLARTSADATAAGDDLLGVGLASTATPGSALGWVSEHGWAGPAALPDGLEMTTLRLLGEDAQVLELDLAGTSGHVVVREQRGRLAPPEDAVEEALGGRTVTVLSTEPWHVAWQAGDLVVDVAADVPRDVLESVLAAFPADGFDGGVLPRIARGWTTVRSAVVSPVQ
jgi:hypothetical protein